MVKINGSSFALQYKRTTSRPIDSTSCFDKLEDARVYARNTDTEVYVPYAGQIISVTENGKTYQLVKDDTVADYPERQHFKLVTMGNSSDIDDAYLSRDKEDTANELIHFMKGIDAHGESKVEDLTTSGTVKSGDYSKGSSGYSIYKDADGNYHLDIYYVNVNGKMTVETLEVKQSYHINGAQWNTKASLIVNRVDGDTLYFKNKDVDGNVITNNFKVGDYAYCKTFNLKDMNRHYWRKVVAVGDDYITLGDGIKGTMKVGDSVVQLGNVSETDRQGATCIDSDSMKVYQNITGPTLPAPMIDLDPVNGAVIKAKFINEATGTDVNDELGMLNTRIEAVKNQTDRQFVMWFEDYAPTMSNAPANGWTTDALKAEHDQDIFYNTSSSAGGGRAYRFEPVNGVYGWKEITDKDTIAALEKAAKAQDTADGKRRVFVSQPTTAQAYDVGDLWANATYQGGGVSYDNDTLVCVTAKAAGDSFYIPHWKPSSSATTAVIKNLGDRITQVVSDMEDTDAAVEQAQKLANQGISDASTAYEAANTAYNKAVSAVNGVNSVSNRLDSTNSSLSDQITAISQNKEAIALLAQGKVKNSNGTVEELSSGLVTDARFNTLLSKKVTFDSAGHVTNIDTSGFVTTSNFAQMFSEKATADGYAKRAEISTFITEDDAGRLISNAEIQADQIRFNGNIIANDSFTVDKEGNVTMNNATVNGGFIGDVTINGNMKAKATSGKKVIINPNASYIEFQAPNVSGTDNSYVNIGFGILNGNNSGYINLQTRNSLGQLVYTTEMYGAYVKARNSADGMATEIDANHGLTLWLSSLYTGFSIGVNGYGYYQVYCRNWPKSSANVDIGGVYLDGTTLKVRIS